MSEPFIAVTGGSGFIGRHVLANLRRKNIRFIAVGRTCPEGIAEGSFFCADLLKENPGEPLKDMGCTHLVHLAWYAAHGLYWTSPLNFDWSLSTLGLIRSFCGEDRHVTAIGTCAEYEWSTGLCIEDQTPLAPATLYGQVKASTGKLAMEACASANTPCCWGRLFLPFGPGENRERLIPSIAEALLGRRGPLKVGGENWRDFLAVEDVADAITHLALSKADGAFNLCSSEPRRILDVVDEIKKIIGGDAGMIDCGVSREGDPRWLIGDNRRLLATGWKLWQSFPARLAAYVNELTK